ncbi:uncharacterized protein ATNIH1004_007126 [Aspergillus tanneri]|uniref:Uncharacterized protein n=1 Tax=Aspergillus tanneri TaxID=1220188 RepID=A0A5M9MT54_9EURO|nr:uncharacterized protein ATNIH1004_007126 [Aspergillus tanneri]KAA8645707.1 hypothetical protein ATNIH1004_007126 [Aspergillus tanneri]
MELNHEVLAASMKDKLSRLGCEVERLVTAQYAHSLQELHELVQHASTASLSSWAAQKPCQLGALAHIVVDGLSRSSYALHLVAPLDFVVPAFLPPFVTNLINSTGDNPCAKSIWPLYQIMTGLQTASIVLYEIPSETMSSLQMELTKTLRTLHDQTENLLCLATFGQIVSSNTAHDQNNQDQLPPWLQNIKYFFGPKRVLKTLELVVLRVILACSSGCSNLTAQQSARSIRIAIEICDSVEQEQREYWISVNPSKAAKLCEKVTRNGIDRDVQILGTTFLVSPVPASALPRSIPVISVQWLLSE